MHILIVEDDRTAARYLQKGLGESGHQADIAGDGATGLEMAGGGGYDVLIVDRMLPQMDGLALIGALRAEGDMTPVLVVSALSGVDERVRGLRSGGDDYLAKPYAFSELLARVEALTRRTAPMAAASTLQVADLELDMLSRTVKRAGRPVNLQPREFKLLEVLMRHQGQVVTRTMLLEQVWDYHFDPRTNVIDVHISRLRAKIDKGFDTALLHTRRGAGYVLGPAEPS